MKLNGVKGSKPPTQSTSVEKKIQPRVDSRKRAKLKDTKSYQNDNIEYLPVTQTPLRHVREKSESVELNGDVRFLLGSSNFKAYHDEGVHE